MAPSTLAASLRMADVVMRRPPLLIDSAHLEPFQTVSLT